MTTAPAAVPATTTQGTQPRPGIALTRLQKTLIGIVSAGTVFIAGLGFAGSYSSVTAKAHAMGFGWYANWITIGVDAGIGVFLALDLLLVWLRIPYPLLRQAAWLLTGATIVFNASTSWPNPLGVGMHAVIPFLFVVAVEAARHAVGRIADITADKHFEAPPVSRWFLDPIGTFRIWRRMRIWNIRSYETVIEYQRETAVYRAKLRKQYGRRWRRKASADARLVLELAANGMTIAEALDLPHQEEMRAAEAEAKRSAEANLARAEAEAEAKRITAEAEAEVEALRRTEAEANREAEVRRAEAEAQAEAEALRRTEAARILKAETEAKLSELARQEAEAEAQAFARRQALEFQATQRRAAAEREEQQRREDQERAARQEQEQREAARRAVAAKAEAKRIAEAAAAASASGGASASGPARKSASASGGAANLGGRRSARQAEVEAVLALITEAGDPKAVLLEDVKERFGLKHAAAWDRLSTARTLWDEAQAA